MTAPAGARDPVFDVYRGVALLAVLGVHVSGRFLPVVAAGSFNGWFALALVNRALQFAVPAFLLLSALLHARGDNGAGATVRRLGRVLGPYLVWSGVYLLFQNRHELGALTGENVLFRLVWGKAYFHLYFLVLLLQLCVVVPLVAPLVRRAPLWAVALGGAAVQLAFYAINRSQPLPFTGSVLAWYVLPVIAGVALAGRSSHPPLARRRDRLALFALWAAGFAWYAPQAVDVLQGAAAVDTFRYQIGSWIYTTSAALLLLVLARRLARTRWPAPILEALGTRSMSIFVLHPLVLWALDRYAPALMGTVALAVPVAVAACIAVPVLCALVAAALGLDGLLFGVKSEPSDDRRAGRRRAIAVAASFVLVLAMPGGGAFPHQTLVSERNSAAVFTSTQSVSALLALADGTLWVGTRGGVRRREPGGTWRTWTREHGLPAHEVRGLEKSQSNGGVTARFPTATAVWDENAQAWRVKSGASPPSTPITATWHGQRARATLAGLVVGEGKTARTFPLPAGATGTHLSALTCAPGEQTLYAAIYGDARLWSFDGRAWQSNVPLPERAREITALAQTPGSLWIGTRRAGVWERKINTNAWTQHAPAGEPADHNAQALMVFNEELFVSTLDDGLLVKTRAAGWRHETTGVLSSRAPRQMVVFGNALLVRHGSGAVDRRDEKGVWTKNVWARALPRRQVFALAASQTRLYAAQWGGWSEGDSRSWTHRLTLPPLQGVPITCLLPDNDTLWVGTQGRGLAEIDRATGAFRRWHNERNGLPDDWVTSLCRAGGALHAGTFVGGLARLAPGATRWSVAPNLRGQNVTALEADGAGGLFVATRAGVWHERAAATGSALVRLAGSALVDPEVQCLHRSAGGLWIGARTGIFLVSEATLRLRAAGIRHPAAVPAAPAGGRNSL